MNFTGEYEAIPDNLRGSIERYVEHRIKPGDFMTAVLNNDLKNAVLRADETSRSVLHLIILWFANNRRDLYGPENFKKHLGTAA